MSYHYFDASVLVKAYLWETGTEDVRRVLGDARTDPEQTQVATSRLTFAEAMSAVARREFAGEMSRGEADEVWRRLRTDFHGPRSRFVVLEPEASLVRSAAVLVRRHRLRAIDAIHLATGIEARRGVPRGMGFRFASADRRLNAAAVSELFDVFDPQSPLPPGTSTPVAPDS